MHISALVKGMAAGAIGLALMAIPSPAQTGAGLPDVVGIRPGMTPQEAYNALKAHGNGGKVGIGQTIFNGVSDKPVVLIMSVRVLDASPAEVVTVYLTLPPLKQQVWAVGRTLTFEPEHEMLKSRLVDALKQKYGPEASNELRQQLGIMDRNMHFWTFDEQGARLDQVGGCLNSGLMNLSQPNNPSEPQPITPLLSMMARPKGCSDLTTILTQFGGSMNGSEYTNLITLTLQDTALARRSHDAYDAYLANADEAKRKEELEKAKQQKAPVF